MKLLETAQNVSHLAKRRALASISKVPHTENRDIIMVREGAQQLGWMQHFSTSRVPNILAHIPICANLMRVSLRVALLLEMPAVALTVAPMRRLLHCHLDGLPLR